MIERSDIEEVDALPVLAPESTSQVVLPRQAGLTVQVATIATGGFVAGAVVAGVLGRRHRKVLARRAGGGLSRRKRATKELVEIVASRSLLVDVHLLGTPARNR
ncbi:MAG TPA: hypothetical protein VNU24_04655 [Solirubrobacteraceae bacterium]|nr:hypothetical protein [Solirubrobacteraceae bacterium]